MRRNVHIPKRREPVVDGARIELDAPEARYAPGDVIRGRVVLEPSAEVRAEAVTVELQLHTQGRIGGVVSLVDQKLFEGALPADQEQSFPFELETPPAPAAYEGRSFRVAPRLAAMVVPQQELPDPNRDLARRLTGEDISMAAMAARAYPEASRPVTIEADERPLTLSLPTARIAQRSARRNVALIVGSALLLVGLVLVILAAWLGLPERFTHTGALVMAMFGVPFTVIGALVLRANLGSWMAERKVGIPEVRAQHRPDAGTLDVTVQLPPESEIDGVTVTLRTREHFTISVDRNADGGTSQRTAEQILAERTLVLAPVAPGSYAGALSLDDFAGLPQTLMLPAAQIGWELDVAVHIADWPDWKDRLRIDAYPGGEQRSLGRPVALTFGEPG